MTSDVQKPKKNLTHLRTRWRRARNEVVRPVGQVGKPSAPINSLLSSSCAIASISTRINFPRLHTLRRNFCNLVDTVLMLVRVCIHIVAITTSIAECYKGTYKYNFCAFLSNYLYPDEHLLTARQILTITTQPLQKCAQHHP